MKPKDRVRATLRVKRYSLRTEKTYCYWIRFHDKCQPAMVKGIEVE
ncbi:phage integrase N-terminal SAM-like domain-containing protein [Halomonas sp. 86]